VGRLNRLEIRFGGFGGQGIVLSGVILGRAFSVYGGKYCAQTQSYGPEARGGACKSEVVVSNQKVDYPMATRLDILVAMSQEAFVKYLPDLKKDGLLIVERDLVSGVPEDEGYRIIRVPATNIADKILGRRVVANIVMLGALARALDDTDPEWIQKAVLDMVPRGTEELNKEAFERGYEVAGS